jgi:uncharacterized membrane protein
MPLRRHGVTRLEGFSDAVFGFALTLLVVSLDVPNNVDELLNDMQGLVGFALTFAMVCWIWYEHNVFFRSYGLEDQWTVFLNCVLLFVVLFYVYPLKFLTAALMQQFFGIGREGGPSFQGSTPNEGAALMLLYSSGIVLLFFIFVMLYRHAWKKRASLDLTEKEELSLKYGQRAHMISMGLGVVSLVIVIANPVLAPIAGMIYGLMGPLHAWNGYKSGKAHSLLDKRLEAS